jgi:DNA (cytosine-5)-methyltransferase 1
MLIPTIGGGFDGPVGVTLHGTDGTASVASLTDLSSSLRARIPSGVENSTTTAVMQPVAFTQNSRSEVRQIGGDGQVVGALAADAGAQQQNYIAFHPTQDPISSSDVCHAIGANKNATAAVALRGRDGGATAELGDDAAFALRASSGGGDKPHVLAAMQVRRLTPVECERLQGFPDNYTAIPWR